MGHRIDLGCGTYKYPGCIGVDLHPGNKPDVLADITKRIKEFDSSSAEFVACRHVMEHLTIPEWGGLIREVGRLLQPGGKFEFVIPHPSWDSAMIYGHLHVLTPQFWLDIQQGRMKLHNNLVVDEVKEIPMVDCVRFCERQGIEFSEWSRYLRNAFIETKVYGHHK